MIVIYNQLRI